MLVRWAVGLLLPAAAAAAALRQPAAVRAAEVTAAHLRAAAAARAAAARGLGAGPLPQPYEVRHYTQRLDHFNAENNGTWQQRYLINDTLFTDGPAPHDGRPIFAFTGAEGGDVVNIGFWGTQFVFNLCISMNGLCIFMEHRFFGDSLPFGGNGTHRPTPEGVGLLSIEQGLADYAALLTSVRDEYDAWGSPLITFGGSLAGTIAALMRVRHPEVVDAAYASSSPFLGWPGIADQFAWQRQVRETYDLFSPGCAAVVRRGYPALMALSKQEVHDRYRTCEPPDDQNGGTVYGIADGQVQGLALSVYPPSLSGLHDSCKAMMEATDDADIFVRLIGTPKGSCLNLTEHRQVDNSPDARGWYWLSCTEVYHPIACNNVTDMCPPFNYSVKGLLPWCRGLFGPSVDQRPRQMAELCGVEHLERFAATQTRVLFTYGTLDPWHTLGVRKQLAPELPVVFVPNGTHCDDLSGDTPWDTPEMLTARRTIRGVLQQWIAARRSR